ncbi:uncharacterized protein LOC110717527 [Chenopodium quinoa]|uniref:uncharacterized protein LOC110717527 n=1 Tax=Chenopodium quinoa TaxID=63459 RepID=UPI000B77B9C8|nr:uncharacterized protein LOC110717527 [Chenopodium quinoa]
MVDLGTKSLLEYGIPDTTTGFLSSIVRPPVTAHNNFLEKCDTMKLNGVTDDTIRLHLFPFSLRDRAREWLRYEEWMLIQTFYNGLIHEFCIYIDAASGGSIMTKNPTDAKDLIEKMATNDNYHPGGRNATNRGDKHDVDALTLLTNYVQALTHKFDQLQAGSPRPSMETFQMCRTQGHTARQCQLNYDGMTIEQENASITRPP